MVPVGAFATSYTQNFDAGNYDAAVFNGAGSVASDAALLTVDKLTPVVPWAAPAAIAYGTSLGAAQLNATANVAGAFTYTPAAAGPGGRARATFRSMPRVTVPATSRRSAISRSTATPAIARCPPAPTAR